jgi:hypothetical protein
VCNMSWYRVSEADGGTFEFSENVVRERVSLGSLNRKLAEVINAIEESAPIPFSDEVSKDIESALMEENQRRELAKTHFENLRIEFEEKIEELSKIK